MKFMMIYICIYAILITIVAFGMFAADKKYSMHRYRRSSSRKRIPEKLLLTIAGIGGSVGAILGMVLFRHKTRRKKFYIGLPAILFAQVAVVMWILSDKY